MSPRTVLLQVTAILQYLTSFSPHSLTHSPTHSLTHSLTEKSQDRLQMFGGLNALSNLLEDLVKQADSVDQLFEDKMEDLLSFIPHVLQTISAATFGNGKWNEALCLVSCMYV